MPGLRIWHPQLTDCTLTLQQPAQPGMRAKDLHIRLDHDGCCLVSDGVWAALQTVADHNFVILNEVADPPEQRFQPFLDQPDPQFARKFRQIGSEIVGGNVHVTVQAVGS